MPSLIRIVGSRGALVTGAVSRHRPLSVSLLTIRSLTTTSGSSPNNSEVATQSTENGPIVTVEQTANPVRYNAPVTYQASRWATIPTKDPQDGSEAAAISAGVTSGAPEDLQQRTVRIYQSCKPATQSGHWHGHDWRMDWDVLPKGHRWENPMIGFQSTGDAMQGERLRFRSQEEAIHFANKQGYQYFVQQPAKRKFEPKVYADQFLYSPGKVKQVRTK